MDRVFITYCLLIFFCSVSNNDSSAADMEAKSGQPPSPLVRNFNIKGLTRKPPKIIFNTAAQSGTDNRGDFTDSLIPTPCPDGATFCESADDYPKNIIKDKLKKLPGLPPGVLYEEDLGIEVHNKIGHETEKELCSYKATIVYPNKAKSKDGGFEFVINDEEHKQGIRIEQCMSNRGPCDLAGVVLSNDYSSICIQKNITKFLVVLNRESSSNVNGFITKPFEFPSCCSCAISTKKSG